MKTILLLLLVSVLAACTGPGGQPIDYGQVISTAANTAAATVAASDRNNDGRVSASESRDTLSNPSTWIALLGTILGAAGVTVASGAKTKAAKVEVETDQQWDKISNLEKTAR